MQEVDDVIEDFWWYAWIQHRGSGPEGDAWVRCRARLGSLLLEGRFPISIDRPPPTRSFSYLDLCPTRVLSKARRGWVVKL